MVGLATFIAARQGGRIIVDEQGLQEDKCKQEYGSKLFEVSG